MLSMPHVGAGLFGTGWYGASVSSRPLRVAVFSESFLPYLSGVTVSVDALARELGRQGHRVLVVAPRPADGRHPIGTSSGPEPGHAWLPSYELAALVPRGYRMPRPLPSRALAAAAAFRPDIVHANSPFVTGLMARWVARRAGAPLVFTHHTRFADYRHYLGPLSDLGARLVDAYLERFWRGCRAIIAPAAGLADEIRTRLGGSRRAIVRAIPTGIDLRTFRSLEPIDPRPMVGWPPDAVVAVTLGRLALEKNVELLLDAFASAAARVPRLRLLVIGSGPAAERLRRRAELPDLAGRVAFAGLQPRAAAIARLRCSDLFVFASLTETQGLVLAEALGAGLPIVALDGPGVSETARDGSEAVIVPVTRTDADREALANAIAELALDRERRARLSAVASVRAEEFALERRVAAVISLYREVRR